MNVNTYNIRYNEDRVGTLVKENTIAYCYEGTYIDSPEKAAEIIETIWDASNLTQEYFWLLSLNGARRVVGAFLVSIGSLTSSIAHPRDVFQRAILSGAASIIIAHNHPSGDLEPSSADNEVTKSIRKAGDIIGIRLDDHIIIANGEYNSIY
jgi:DNA repair protein RadC